MGKRLALAFAVFALACTNKVKVVKPDGTGGSGSTTTTTTSGPSGGGQTVPAVANTRAQMDVLWDEYWKKQMQMSGSGVTTSTGSGEQLDPDDLFLRLSDLGVSCASPTVDLSCGGHWQMSIVLPKVAQAPGTYELSKPPLNQFSYFSETGKANSPAPDDCSFGGGSVFAGTLEISSIDAKQVHFRISGAKAFDTNPDGEYTAQRCP
jgi:hypothetical protein